MQESPRTGPLTMQWVAVDAGTRPRMEMRWVADSPAPVVAGVALGAVLPLGSRVTHAA